MFAEWQGFNKSVLGILGCQEAKLEILGISIIVEFNPRTPKNKAVLTPSQPLLSPGTVSTALLTVDQTEPGLGVNALFVCAEPQSIESSQREKGRKSEILRGSRYGEWEHANSWKQRGPR
ncbi:unnamed protein product [Leuciscus chuanchicus]